MGNYESLMSALIGFDTVLKTSTAHPKLSCRIVRHNNYLVLDKFWFNGTAAQQRELRNTPSSEANLSFAIRSLYCIAMEHDLMPVISDAGFLRENIGKCLNEFRTSNQFDFYRVQDPSFLRMMKSLIKLDENIYALKGIRY